MSDTPPPPSGMPVAVRTWGSVIVSVIVLLSFGATLWAILTHAIPAGSDAIANVVVGAESAFAGAVVNYWLGSSAGSAAKDAKR